jgi:hypothetical protein
LDFHDVEEGDPVQLLDEIATVLEADDGDRRWLGSQLRRFIGTFGEIIRSAGSTGKATTERNTGMPEDFRQDSAIDLRFQDIQSLSRRFESVSATVSERVEPTEPDVDEDSDKGTEMGDSKEELRHRDASVANTGHSLNPTNVSQGSLDDVTGLVANDAEMSASDRLARALDEIEALQADLDYANQELQLTRAIVGLPTHALTRQMTPPAPPSTPDLERASGPSGGDLFSAAMGSALIEKLMEVLLARLAVGKEMAASISESFLSIAEGLESEAGDVSRQDPELDGRANEEKDKERKTDSTVLGFSSTEQVAIAG